MRIRIGRIVLLAIANEVAAIVALVLIVAVFGPQNRAAARAFAEKVGFWFGPLSGGLLCLVAGYWVARRLPSAQLLNGAFLGIVAAGIDIALLVASGASFQPVFAVSNALRVSAGLLGGWLAMRSVSTHRTIKEPGP